MQNETFQLRYLPLFEQDLLDTVDYITNVLQNEDAAQRLIDDVEAAILKRLCNPLSFKPYYSAMKRDYPYYRMLHTKNAHQRDRNFSDGHYCVFMIRMLFTVVLPATL